MNRRHYSNSIHSWRDKKSLGSLQRKSLIDVHLYNNVKVVKTWNPRDTVAHSDLGGVFNFDFSPDGKLMVAATERHSILMFDPLRAQPISCNSNAHSNCVNCVRFLDSRLFATCSDDTNIALWDARYLKRHICLLHGHSNWVKNIEYSQHTGRLVTSGFDGSIFSWDINRYSEGECTHEQLFKSNGLIRTKLTADASKMIISTSAGYLIIIHDLDLTTLAQDLYGFKPDIFRLMQLTKSIQRLSSNYKHLFTRSRNRVEFISDFPSQNDAEVISSLQVHPQGWCVLSRNTSSDDRTEWSCVHDIQARPIPETDNTSSDAGNSFREQENSDALTYTHTLNSLGAALMFSIMGDQATSNPPNETNQPFHGGDNLVHMLRGARPRVSIPTVPPAQMARQNGTQTSSAATRSMQNPRFSTPAASTLASRPTLSATSRSAPSTLSSESHRAIRPPTSDEPEITRRITRSLTRRGLQRNTTENVYYRVPPSRQSRQSHFTTSTQTNATASTSRDTRNIPSPATSQSPASTISSGNEEEHEAYGSYSRSNIPPHRIVTFRLQLDGSHPELRRPEMARMLTRTVYLSGFGGNDDDKTVRIHDNVPRLLAFTEEANTGRGFIKEPCFTTDGRIICSPFGFGVRLLSFNQSCSELCDCIPDKPIKLHEVANCIGHSNAVVTTKFSPVHNLLVTGCLDGKISFLQPRFDD